MDHPRYDIYSVTYVGNHARTGRLLASGVTGSEADAMTGLSEGDTAWCIEEHGQSDTGSHIVVPFGAPKPTPWES